MCATTPNPNPTYLVQPYAPTPPALYKPRCHSPTPRPLTTRAAATDPIAGWDFLLEYFPVSDADDSCANNICACTTGGESWEIQQGRVALDTTTSLSASSGVSAGFGMHLVNLTNRETTGGNTVSEIEQIFADKLGDLSSYDAFMDYSIGLYTTDLDQYITALDKDSIKYLTSTWVNSDSGADWTSILLLVPGTHMVVELYGEDSSYGLQRKLANTTHNEVRLGSTQAAFIKAHVGASTSSDLLYATRVSRGASDLDAIDSFYLDVMGASLDIDSTTDDYERHCFKYTTSSTVDVCFTKRDDSATSSDFAIADMEAQMNGVHANLLQKNTCGTDKWLDNHHAFDAHTSNADIVTYLDSKAGSDTYYYCEPSGTSYALHYIIDPTGWGIQLDMQASSQPTGCTESARQIGNLRATGNGNPACDLGSC